MSKQYRGLIPRHGFILQKSSLKLKKKKERERERERGRKFHHCHKSVVRARRLENAISIVLHARVDDGFRSSAFAGESLKTVSMATRRDAIRCH